METTEASLGARLSVEPVEIELALEGDSMHHLEGVWIYKFFQA